MSNSKKDRLLPSGHENAYSRNKSTPAELIFIFVVITIKSMIGVFIILRII